jgi:hypothetical protein
MDNQSSKRIINWRWVETGFCLYVLFHLFPLYVLFFSRSGAGEAFSFALWTFIGLAPIGCYIGYRSVGFTILEPGISALLYSLVLVVGMILFHDESVGAASVALSLAWMGAAFLIAVVSAWVGEKIQQSVTTRREKVAG